MSDDRSQLEPSGIVANRAFILATRETGYRDVSAAIAELVDNSLQAGARRVDILIREERDDSGRRVMIGVLDDGHGMSAKTLRTAVQFGGSERFDDRSGFGRFGMGLPNSSVSQTRRVEVYSWRAPDATLYTYLDVDEIAAGILDAIPSPIYRPLPEWSRPHARKTGTLVLWTRCDRIGRHRTSAIVSRLRTTLGRLYRFALWDGIRIRVNDMTVKAIDPLFLDSRCALWGAVPFGEQLRYEFCTPRGGTSLIDVRFAELPITEWSLWSSEEKRRLGIVGAAGVSIVRSGREIDYGWYLMGSKRRENYDDWWRCQIEFSPELDELFGVTHSKQGITPSAELLATLGPDVEAIARGLNARVRRKFELRKSDSPSTAVRAASETDRFLAPPRSRRRQLRAGGFRYRIDSAPIAGPDFYRTRLRNKTVIVVLNREHPFFTQLYEPARTGSTERDLHDIECLLLAAVRAELDSGDAHRDVVARLRRSWSDALATFLDP